MTGLISYCFRNNTGKILAAKNEKASMLPASNMKIVSGYAAYSILRPSFTMKTVFYTANNRILVSGDPCPLLRFVDLRSILEDMRCGMPESVVFDNTVLDDDEFGHGWEMDDTGMCYQSGIVPYAINEGCTDTVGSTFSPDKDMGDVHARCRYCVPDQYLNFSHSIGKILGSREDPSYMLKAVTEENISRIHEEKLTDILTHIETYSCNYSIEVLTKYLSYIRGKRKGNWKDSIDIITEMISSMGLNSDGVSIVDGSGLSRHNLMTTDFLSEFLYRVGSGKDRDFIRFLPSPGSGTMSGRLSDLKEMNINAKTGSFSYCSSLSGHIGNNDVYFSIFLNNYTRGNKEIAAEVDDILRSFLNGNLH